MGSGLAVVETALVLPDMQIRAPRDGYPEGEQTGALEAVYRYAEDNAPWNYVVQIGDFLDLPYFSKHKTNTAGQKYALQCWDEDRERGKTWLNRFGRLGDRRYLIEGNHDFRAVQYAKENPHLKTLVDMSAYVKEAGWKWVPYWTTDITVKIGKAEFGHGMLTNKYHAEAHARRYLGANFFYGHVHDVQSYTPAVRGLGQVPITQSMGCLCNMEQPWLHHAHSHNWAHAFGIFHFLRNGNFNYYVARLYNDEFVSPDGRWLYSG